jgi:hypothetical protein
MNTRTYYVRPVVIITVAPGVWVCGSGCMGLWFEKERVIKSNHGMIAQT